MNDKTESALERAFAGVANNYGGNDVDLYPIYREMRKNSPIIAEDFMSKIGVPNIARYDADRKTFTVFKHKDVMAVLRTPPTTPAVSSPRASGPSSTA
jgi:hypothetical protein